MTMTDTIALEVRNITKQFPGVLANDQVSLNLKKGEIHALLGENGAGKTTLMNMVYGLYHPDSGQILVDGKEVACRRSDRCHHPGHRHGAPALHVDPGLHRGGEHHAGQ